MLVPYQEIIHVKLNCSFKFPEHENIVFLLSICFDQHSNFLSGVHRFILEVVHTKLCIHILSRKGSLYTCNRDVGVYRKLRC